MPLRVIYIDELLAVNLLLDYFILLATAKICAIFVPRRRLWLAAALGAAYAAATAFPPVVWLGATPLKLLCGAAMLAVAFGFHRRFARLALVFFAVSAAAAGACMAAVYLGGATLARMDLRVLVAAFGVSYVAITLVFRRAARVTGGTTHDLVITVAASPRNALHCVRGSPSTRHLSRAASAPQFQHASVRLRALQDTGNSLTDPITGARTCVATLADLLPLFPPDTHAALAAAVQSIDYSALVTLNTLQTGVKLRLLPYSAVGTEVGALLCFRPTAVTVDGIARTDLVIAISPTAVGDGTHTALL